MRLDPRRLAGLAAVALATLMGVHALRGSLAMIVWNLGVDRPAPVLGGIALIVYGVGLAGWGFGIARGRQAGIGRVLVLAAAYTLSHLLRHTLLTPALTLASLVGWLWTYPALIARLGVADAAEVIGPGVLTGFAAAAALQTALHGLDLPMLRGVVPGLGALAIAAALLGAWQLMPPGSPDERPSADGLPGWGLIAFGPYLMLQLTLLSNLGRVQTLGGEGLPVGLVPIVLGLGAGAALMAFSASMTVRAIAAAASIALVLPAVLEGRGIVLIPLAQIALSVTLGAALHPVPTPRVGRTYLAGAVGLLLTFICLFAYYSRYEWPALWPVLAALVALPALVRGTPRRVPATLTAATAAGAAVVVVGLAGLAAGSIPSRGPAQPAQLPAELRLLDYNIHMAFDASGLPDPQGIAAAITRAGADVVALQEVGRGWTVNGGADLFAWLRWRFPDYRAIYGPMNGTLWGNALLVRHPIGESGSVRFPLRVSPFQRGLTWATLPASSGDLLIIATHFAHEVTADADRLEQAGDLLAFWRGRPRTIVMGDLNATPASAPVTRLEAAGLRNALAPFGLAAAPTYPSPAPVERIDYVLLTSDLEPVAASIPRTTASDHLPVVVQVRRR